MAALAQMLPYLTIKRRQAEVAVGFPLNFHRASNPHYGSGRSVIPEMARTKRETIAQKLKELKQKC